ncbi:MAG: FtsQ-type POTRA domain-containing protein [Acidimicrobiia bacterium]|nr:FtsQ-type POTRA domain-containing protein [Acidimicrobiia bacterium]
MTDVRERPATAVPQRGRVRPGPWIFALVVTVVAIGLGVLHSPWLSLAEVEVRGAVASDPAEAVAETGVGEGAVMIWIDTDAVAAAVTADPWVADAIVRREFPDRLVVEVLEREAVVWVEGLRTWMLVSGDGVVLERSDAPGPGVLRARVAARDVVPGATTDERAWREVVDLAGALPADLAQGAVAEFRAGELWLSLTGASVRLGTPSDLADKATVAAAIVADGVPDGSVIDVVSPRRPAVVPPPPPLVTDPQPVVEGDTLEP